MPDPSEKVTTGMTEAHAGVVEYHANAGRLWQEILANIRSQVSGEKVLVGAGPLKILRDYLASASRYAEEEGDDERANNLHNWSENITSWLTPSTPEVKDE